jgi:hypothetical protein
MSLKIFAFAAALLAATPAAAESWYRVGLTDQSATYLDLDMTRPILGRAVVWERRIWFAPTQTGMIMMESRLEIDCNARSYSPTYNISYNSDGTSDGWAPEAETHQASSGTIADRVLRFACGDTSVGQRVADPFADARSQG